MLDYWQGFLECLFCTPFLMDIVKMCYMYFGDLMDQGFFVYHTSHYQKFGTCYKSIRNGDCSLLKM